MPYKILYIGLPYYSHVNPSLVLLKELIKRGNKVLFQGVGNLSSELENIGAIKTGEVDYCFNPTAKEIEHPLLGFRKLFETNKKLELSLGQIIKKEKPDCLFHNQFCLWGKLAAQKYHLPAVSLVVTFILTPRILLKYRQSILSGMNFSPSDLINLPKIIKDLVFINLPDLIINEEDLTLVATSKNFQPLGDKFKTNYKFIGPLINFEKRNLNSTENSKKKIYFSLGTVHGTVDLYKKCLNILGKIPYSVIASVGNTVKISDLGSVPSNIEIKNFVNQIETLEKVDLFISHAGMNSVSESLYCGVPLIMIPLLNEQVINATRVVEFGGGLMLNKKNLGNNLLEAIQKILTTTSFKQNVAKIRESFLEDGGYQRGAEEIINYLNEKSSGVVI